MCPQLGYGNVGGLERLPGTHVWFRTFKTKNACFGGYRFVVNPPRTLPTDMRETLRLLRRRAKLDPLNPSTWTRSIDPECPSNPLFGVTVSVLELPGAPRHRELEEQPNVPKGRLVLHRFRSRNLRNSRRVWIYTPATARRLSSRTPLVVFFDGFGYTSASPTPTILDNLIATGQIPPVVAVFVDSIDLAVRDRELPGYAPFGRFLARELLPWIRTTIGYTPRPRNTVLAGLSYGGLAALYWTVQKPNLFQRVLAQTGAFGWSPKGVDEPEWLVRELMRHPRLPLRIYLDGGRCEYQSDVENRVGHLAAIRHLRDVLRMRGYPLLSQEFCGAHDLYCCRQTLVDGLRWVLSDQRSAS